MARHDLAQGELAEHETGKPVAERYLRTSKSQTSQGRQVADRMQDPQLRSGAMGCH